MARLAFNGCDPDYIKNTCHAHCCESSTTKSGTLICIHPTEKEKITARGGKVVDGLMQPVNKRCPFKTTDNLCGLHYTNDKPFGCIASPFTLNKNDTLIVRNRYKMLRCYNDGKKQPAYRAFSTSLVIIFGEDKASKIIEHFDQGGGDILMTMSAEVYGKIIDNDNTKHATTQSRAEQSRAEQSRAEQSRAEQSRAEQSRAEQSSSVHAGQQFSNPNSADNQFKASPNEPARPPGKWAG